MRFPGWSKPPRVYVDAKILNMHDQSLAREAFVGYVVEGGGQRCAKRLEESETAKFGRLESDDAEILAILFAIRKLKGPLKRFTVVCDHESVVSEANKEEEVKNPSTLLLELRNVLRENKQSITLEALKANPAHGVVTAFVNGQEPENDCD